MCLGKFCLVKEQLAKKLIDALSTQLNGRQPDVVRCNALAVRLFVVNWNFAMLDSSFFFCTAGFRRFLRSLCILGGSIPSSILNAFGRRRPVKPKRCNPVVWSGETVEQRGLG